MFFSFNKTVVKDDSLEVQSKEHAVKAFNKLIHQRDDINGKIQPLVKNRNEINSRMIELCDQARVCLVLTESKILNKQQENKVRSTWDKYIKEHGKLSENMNKIQLEIDSLSLERKKIVEEAREIYRRHELFNLEIEFPR